MTSDPTRHATTAGRASIETANATCVGSSIARTFVAGARAPGCRPGESEYRE